MGLFPSSMEGTDKNCSYRMPFDQAVLPLRGCDPPSPKEDTNATYPPVNLQHNLKNWWFPVEHIIIQYYSSIMQHMDANGRFSISICVSLLEEMRLPKDSCMLPFLVRLQTILCGQVNSRTRIIENRGFTRKLSLKPFFV